MTSLTGPEDEKVDMFFTQELGKNRIAYQRDVGNQNWKEDIPLSTTGHIRIGRNEYVCTSLVVHPQTMESAKIPGNPTSPWAAATWEYAPGSGAPPPPRGAVASPAYFGAIMFGQAMADNDEEEQDDNSPAEEGARAFFGAAAPGRGFGRQREEGGAAPPQAKRPRRQRAASAAPGQATAYSFIEVSVTMLRRWGAAATDLNAATRLAKLAFLLSPVNDRVLQELIRSNDVFPFGFLLMRPYMTYLMGTGILTVAGRGTGETLIGHADFQLADNVIQKMHVGNFTMYLKSIVYQQQNVFLAENIFAQGYVSGNNMEFWTAEKSAKASFAIAVAVRVPKQNA